MAAAPSSYKDRQFLAVIGDEVPFTPLSRRRMLTEDGRTP